VERQSYKPLGSGEVLLEQEQNLEQGVTLPKRSQEDCKQSRHHCNRHQHSGGSIYHIDRSEQMEEGVAIDSKSICG
jgi:hypothetical protein